jgi:diguanylate cyclase (GGDEF)-like protein
MSLTLFPPVEPSLLFKIEDAGREGQAMGKNNILGQLFSKELSVLQHAAEVSRTEQSQGTTLLAEYRKLVQEYERLLKSTQHIYRISDTQAKHLKRRETEIENLLDNVNQGFLTFGSDLQVDREYSAECLRIFNKKIGGLDIIALLSETNPRKLRLFQRVLTQVFKAVDSETATVHLRKLPGIVKVNEHYINIKAKLIVTDENDAVEWTVMLILTDITEKQTTQDWVMYFTFHDKLTSLYNRAYVDNIIPQLQLESTLPISIIMADMNGLKLTNDVFGHQSGDKLLINIAQVLLKCCRKKDIVTRWGGDEFLIILPGSDSDACERVCERIRQTCRRAEADPIGLSVSLGDATLTDWNTDLLSLVSVAENKMYSEKVTESRDFRRKIILNMEQTLQTKCFEESGHMQRLQTMAAQFARKLGMAEGSKEWDTLMMLATDHDIGKMTIPRAILGKSGPLEPGEWQIMRTHPEIGYRMAESIGESLLAQAILAIREHYDGGGYPYGLRGEAIPLLSRIIAIVDAYDVITHDRPYRGKRSPAEAAQELQRCAGRQFDPELTRLFLLDMPVVE